MSVFGIFLSVFSPVRTDWIRRYTPYLSVFSVTAGKCGPEKLRIRTLFTQWIRFRSSLQEVFYQKSVLKNRLRPTRSALLKLSAIIAGVSLWIFRSFSVHLFHKTLMNVRFWHFTIIDLFNKNLGFALARIRT